MLGIVIGVAAIIGLFSISQGLENSMTREFQKMGTQLIMVFPTGTVSSSGFTDSEVDYIDKLGYFDYVSGFSSSVFKMEYGGEEINYFVYAIDSENFEKLFTNSGYMTDKGRYIKSGERNKIVFGYKAAEDLFGKEVKTKTRLKIEGKSFTVVGIVEEIGSAADDMQVYIAKEDFDKMSDETNAQVLQLFVKEGLNVNEVATKLEEKFERKRGTDNFKVFTSEQLLKQFSSFIVAIQAVLIGVASISLIVGMTGIMNSMYTSVSERTKEIGILKAIGAKKLDLLSIFMIESAMIGIAGGLLGSSSGLIFSKIVEALAAAAGYPILKVYVSPYLFLFGVVFALFISVIAGYLPSSRAANLKVVEAFKQ